MFFAFVQPGVDPAHAADFISYGFGAAGAAGATGPQGSKGDPGTPGTWPVAQWGPYQISGREDGGCNSGQEVWAHDNETRYFVVTPAQDGTGYFVTRYDLNGTYTTIPTAQ